MQTLHWVMIAKRLTIIALALTVVAAFALVDTPATVRTKSLIINTLPLDAQTKIGVVTSLCQAAYAGNFLGSTDCYAVNHSKAAWEQIIRRLDDARRKEACDLLKERIIGGDLESDWRHDGDFYLYIGSDPILKGRFLHPELDFGQF
jgi:hypothetical protein